VNLSNKEGRPSAEMGEGRARAKENIAGSHTRPTQSGERVSQGLRGVQQVARERRKERFTALLHHLSVDLLRDSFLALKRHAAPGVDGVTWKEYETGLENRLADLHNRVHGGAYRAQASRRVYIPKADGRQRPLGVAALEDKIVQQAVVTILNEIYEVDLGFTHYCGKRRKDGAFILWRETAKKRLVAKLQAIKKELKHRRHEPIPSVGAWLRQMTSGYYQYHAVPGNLPRLQLFRWRLSWMWCHALSRRSQRSYISWDRLKRLMERWIPSPRVLHPYPMQRFDASHPRREPYA
jgi:hypothetical protein